LKKVLFVTSRREDVRELFYRTRSSWTVEGLSDPNDAPAILKNSEIDFVFFDIALTGASALDLLPLVVAAAGARPVFILSREGAFCFHKETCSLGAAGYFLMPYSAPVLIDSVERIFSAQCRPDSSPCAAALSPDRESAAEPRPLGYAAAEAADCVELELLGSSRPMAEARSLIRRYARLREPVLITGETGTGKDVASRLIHRLSALPGPFVPINVSCLPVTLAESALFGTERGCYTDARDCVGLVAYANNGTLFLDEIGDLDPSLQPKLLRVIEDGTVTRLGSTKATASEFRLVCATNRSLDSRVEEGFFRRDLLYRIDVLRIALPSLRDRPEDIPSLAASFLPRYGKKLSEGALDKLFHHTWPGNVRELYHCLSRAALASEAVFIQPDSIPF